MEIMRTFRGVALRAVSVGALLFALTGCVAGVPANEVLPLPSGAPGYLPPPTSSVSVGAPALCTSPEPPPLDPFPYNRDSVRRDRLVGVAPNDPYLGGIAYFYDADANDVAALIDAKFVNPYESQNEAPTVWEIFQLQCRYPQVLASGYVVSPDRPDYRTSIDDIHADRSVTMLREPAREFCADAEDMDFTVESFECFWD
jgi:hypothetical protein